MIDNICAAGAVNNFSQRELWRTIYDTHLVISKKHVLGIVLFPLFQDLFKVRITALDFQCYDPDELVGNVIISYEFLLVGARPSPLWRSAATIVVSLRATVRSSRRPRTTL